MNLGSISAYILKYARHHYVTEHLRETSMKITATTAEEARTGIIAIIIATAEACECDAAHSEEARITARAYRILAKALRGAYIPVGTLAVVPEYAIAMRTRVPPTEIARAAKQPPP